MEVPAAWEGQQVNASDILDALRKHHKGAALVHEVVVTDPWAQSNHISGTGHTNHSRRIDALMVESLQLTAIEIKISKADLARETWAKTVPWRRITHRYVYAVPAGLTDKAPFYGAGLWWVHEDGRVEVRKKARVQKYPEPLPQQVVQALMYRAASKSPVSME